MSKHKSKKKQKVRKKPQRSLFENPGATWIGLGIISVVTFLALSPLLSAGFVDIDDSKLILNKANMFLNDPGRVFSIYYGSPYYKPITYFTWMLEYRAVGPEPFLYHFNNILLHLLNTVLVFFLARGVAERFEKLKSSILPIAFFTSLLFGLHPMHVESVGWAVERKDVLFTCFYLLGLLTYVRYLNTERILPLALSVVAYVLSVLSKAPGLTLPAVLFLLDIVWKRKLSSKLFIEKAGHLGVFFYGLFALGIVGGRHSGEGSVQAIFNEKKLGKSENIAEHSSLYGKTVLAGLRAWMWYIHSWFPFRLSLGYPREQFIGFFGPFIHVFPWLLAAAGGFLLWARKRFPILFFGHVFFFLTLAPAIVRLDIGIGIYMSDRYVYLPLFGLIFLLVAWLMSLQERSWLNERVKYGILIVLAAAAAIGSFRVSHIWKSTETLWSNTIEKYPEVDYAWVNRGSYYRDQNQFDKALADLNKAISLDANANAYMQRGLVYRQMGDPGKALEDYNKSLELESDNTQGFTNRGNAYLDLGRYRLAIKDYERVLDKEPWNIKTRVNLAIAHSSLEEFELAEKEFAEAEKHNQGYADLYVNRAIMYFSSGQYAKAARDYESYLALRPDDHQIYYDRAVVYTLMGNHQKALESVSQAINLSPVKDYYLLRARAYDNLGNAAAAAQDRRMAQ